ncbi:formylglycine-generating enzyme family protein [Endothiovibrio diazotrophicus]
MNLDPNPPEFPASWAVAWGEDCYGLWQAFAIGEVRQVMRWIEPGSFLMGSPEEEPERESDETQHPVTLTQGFWLAETACTRALWQALTGEDPSRSSGSPNHPVNSVSWDDCQRFLQRANERLAGLTLRLPSEAEWEYACRAGTRGPFSWGEQLPPGQANYWGEYPYNGGPKDEDRDATVEVDRFPPNPRGLYQMHGNVWEWCADWLGDYPEEPVVDPAGPPEGRSRMLRGGSWVSHGLDLRSARRMGNPPGSRLGLIGFRLAGG